MIKRIQIEVIVICLFVLGIACNTQKVDSEQNKKIKWTELRGVVVYPSDLISLGVEWWVNMMTNSDLNLLGIHAASRGETIPNLKKYIESEEGQKLQSLCKKNGIDIEYELHALQYLLPRELCEAHPEYFRMDKEGKRQQQYNMCFSSEKAYHEIEKKVVEITNWLKPTTHRYFFWTDDVLDAFCHCEKCKKYTASEQSLIFENKLLEILRKIDPKATVAHLAYYNTLPAPAKVKPANGIFLEYAPIERNSEVSQDIYVQSLIDNLEVFPKETSHILEYWLDVSKVSHWNPEKLVEIPWKKEYCERDVELYRSLGVNSITSFATWINRDYIHDFGEEKTLKILNEYGEILNKK